MGQILEIERIRANAFLDECRLVHRLAEKRLSGPYTPDDDIYTNIIDACQVALSTNQRFRNASMQNDLESLLLKLEKLCDRHRIKIPARLRPAIATVLLEDLATNMRVFGLKKCPKTLLTFTLYQGNSFADIYEDPEFDEFKTRRKIILCAINSHPLAPRPFLKDVAEKVEALRQNDNLSILIGKNDNGRLSVFYYAATFYKHPEEYLEPIAETLKSIINDENLSAIHRNMRILRHMVSRLGEKAPEKAAEVIAKEKELREDARFEELQHHPSIFLDAAYYHDKNPAAYLSQQLDLIKKMKKEPEFSIFMNHQKPWMFLIAIINRSTDPRGWLRDVRDGQIKAPNWPPREPIADLDLALEA